MSWLSIIIVMTASCGMAIVLTVLEIPVLQRLQAGQNIREEGPKSHLKKAGTPSMGGVAIVLAILVGILPGGIFTQETAVICITIVLFALIGFFDDYLKVVKKNNLGLRAWQKFGLQMIFAIAFAIYMAKFSLYGTQVFIPFANTFVDFGIWYIPYIAFVMLAMVNAVNLTDGLDGLASGVTAICSIFFIIAVMVLNRGAQGTSYISAIFFAAIVGACIGFLVFNKNPAKIFMGDTGSLALGSGITAAAMIMRMELFLPIVGFVFLAETLSVCIQVGYFKLSGGKRVFKMAPIHHHFELCGMKEVHVVFMFWGVSVIFMLIGILAASIG